MINERISEDFLIRIDSSIDQHPFIAIQACLVVPTRFNVISLWVDLLPLVLENIELIKSIIAFSLFHFCVVHSASPKIDEFIFVWHDRERRPSFGWHFAIAVEQLPGLLL